MNCNSACGWLQVRFLFRSGEAEIARPKYSFVSSLQVLCFKRVFELENPHFLRAKLLGDLQ